MVLHAKAGNALGELGSYDYFSLGGPYSVRGYSHGELGAARRFVELASEVRGLRGRGHTCHTVTNEACWGAGRKAHTRGGVRA